MSKIFYFCGQKFIKNKYASYNQTYISACGKFFLKRFRHKITWLRESSMLSYLHHHNCKGIVYPREVIDDDDGYYIEYPNMEYSSELCSGKFYSNFNFEIGSKSDLMIYNPNLIFYKIVEIVENLHKLNIVHLDIKPANFLYNHDYNRKNFSSELSDNLHLIDFEYSERVCPNSVSHLSAIRGSYSSVCPEIVKYRNISQKSDIWSLGVLYYILHEYDYPFHNDGVPTSYKVEDMKKPVNMNESSRELLSMMLVNKSRERSNVSEIKKFMEENII